MPGKIQYFPINYVRENYFLNKYFFKKQRGGVRLSEQEYNSRKIFEHKRSLEKQKSEQEDILLEYARRERKQKEKDFRDHRLLLEEDDQVISTFLTSIFSEEEELKQELPIIHTVNTLIDLVEVASLINAEEVASLIDLEQVTSLIESIEREDSVAEPYATLTEDIAQLIEQIEKEDAPIKKYARTEKKDEELDELMQIISLFN